MQECSFFPTALSNEDALVLSGSTPSLHIQPECRCPPMYPVAGETLCSSFSGESSVPRVNLDSNDISLINDGDDSTHWQSSLGEEQVNVTVDLQALREVVYFSAYFISPVPVGMVLLYSTDGMTFAPRQFYARDCSAQFGLPSNGLLSSSTDVNCVSGSQLQYPFTNRYIEFSLIGTNSRPNAQTSTHLNLQPELQKFAQATHVRLALFGWHPEQSEEQQFFAINEILLTGRACVCNGHASACEQDLCVCQHQTQGDHCETCLALYNNQPWLAGTVSLTNECEMCQCYDHAQECRYNSTLGKGQCVNCQHNTTGDQCEQCTAFLYHPSSEPLESPYTCASCDCHSDGVADDGDCKKEANDDGAAGQCNCKTFATTQDCGQCASGYFNLTGANPEACLSCNCSTMGTIGGSIECEQSSGQCACLPNVIGLHCDGCAANHYGLGEPTGCLPCDSECDECQGPSSTQCLVSGYSYIEHSIVQC